MKILSFLIFLISFHSVSSTSDSLKYNNLILDRPQNVAKLVQAFNQVEEDLMQERIAKKMCYKGNIKNTLLTLNHILQNDISTSMEVILRSAVDANPVKVQLWRGDEIYSLNIARCI